MSTGAKIEDKLSVVVQNEKKKKKDSVRKVRCIYKIIVKIKQSKIMAK